MKQKHENLCLKCNNVFFHLNQATTYDETSLPPGGWSRRESQSMISPETDNSSERQARRDSLSPDSASRYYALLEKDFGNNL